MGDAAVLLLALRLEEVTFCNGLYEETMIYHQQILSPDSLDTLAASQAL
jgi:hypothetical protein